MPKRDLPRAMREPPPWPAGALGPPTPRHALLVNPFYAKDPHASFGKHVLTPTLALTSVAGATPAEWDVRYWDENLLQGPVPARPFPQVVGITVHLTFARRAYELARFYRCHGAKVVLGGLHVEACADEAARHADAIALGEGTAIWPLILQDAAAGRLRPVYRGDYRCSYADLPPPRRDLLARGSYLTTASLTATRGCHNRCDFCYLATDGLRMPYRMRRPEQLVAEWLADDQPYAVFTDNNLGSNREYLYDLCAALQPLGRIWSAAVSPDVTADPGLVRAMAQAGCTGVFVGFETLDDRNLRDAGKRGPSAGDFAHCVQVFHDNGIQVNASYVFGFDHDRPNVFGRTVQWLERHRLECATFHILTPYPGTPLFRRLEAEGRLLHKDWSRYDTAHVVFRPRHMTPEQLAEGYAVCYERLFSHRSIWRRRPAELAALPTYLGMAYLYKRSNRLWEFLIRRQLTHALWRPLVERSRAARRAARGSAGLRAPRAAVQASCRAAGPADGAVT